MNYETIIAKKTQLEFARDELKKRFFGIDFIIDDVINRISSWYIFPELNTRPAILCLWGMTGVGKTDLIRNLTSLLGLGESFHEIQLSGSSSSGHSTISSTLNYSKILPNNQGILLLDEIQRYRTVTEDGTEKNDYQYSDIWMLLSDGKLPASSALDELFDLLFDVKNSEDKRAKKTKVPKKSKTVAQIIKMMEAGKETIQMDDEEEEEEKTNISTWRAKNLKKDHQLEESIDEITKWTSVEIGKLFDKVKKQDFLTRNYDDYSKLLIVISGNLDEAFREAFDVDDTDMEADLMHEMTKRINMLTIKGALLRRFKPEQIARFGNNHITYPTLSRSAFTQIIERSLAQYFSFLEERSDIKVLMMGHSIVEFIYNNSVFPAQGTRPVLSTISDFTNVCFPPIILNAIEHGHTTIHIMVENSHVVSDKGDKVYYKADIEEIRKNTVRDHNLQSLIAVHEAGHAVAQMVLFGVAPFRLRLHDKADGGATWTVRAAPSKEACLANIQVMYAGQIAERLIFGDSNISTGAGADIEQATKLITAMLRSGGMYSHHTSIVEENYSDAFQYNVDIMPSNAELISIADDLYDKATALVTLHKEDVVKLAKVLLEERKMNSERITEIASTSKWSILQNVRAMKDNQINDYLYPYSYADALENA